MCWWRLLNETLLTETAERDCAERVLNEIALKKTAEEEKCCMRQKKAVPKETKDIAEGDC